jgi:hypothetical protein
MFFLLKNKRNFTSFYEKKEEVFIFLEKMYFI